MIFTDFMEKLVDDLNTRDLSEKTVELYIHNLTKISECVRGKKQFNDLNFLKKIDKVMECLDLYSPATRKTCLGTILSVLKASDKKSLNKLHQKYMDILNGEVQEDDKEVKNVKNDKQSENWMDWDEILQHRDALWENAKIAYQKKNPTQKDYETLLMNVILSLYCDQLAPRRNEYMYMFIVPKGSNVDDKEKNFVIMDDSVPEKLVFNRYKTNKTYGQQEFDITDDKLKKSIQMYLKNHPIYSKRGNRKGYEIPLLVNEKGLPLNTINAITRILNKVFRPKKIGASMLRHSYLSSKYNISEMKEDADEMGHSINQQKEYMLE